MTTVFRYEFERENPFYRDALVGDEYAALSKADLEAAADARHEGFKAVLAAAADAPAPSPLDEVRGALSEAQTAIQGLQPDEGDKVDPARQQVLDAAMASLDRATTAAQGIVDTAPSVGPLTDPLADYTLTGQTTTFESLVASAAPGVDGSKVHGLKLIQGKALDSLPFQLNDDQQAYTCVCGSGWLTITSDEDAAREALKAHIAGA